MSVDDQVDSLRARILAQPGPASIEDQIRLVAPDATIAIDRDLMRVKVAGVTDEEYEAIRMALPLTIGLTHEHLAP